MKKNPDYLTHFSPEGIVLLYLHSISLSDWETIYSLTYDDGTLPDLAEFNELYYDSPFITAENDSTLIYRYFTQLETRPENQTDEEVLVELSVSMGINHYTVVYGLKKESSMWKMDILDIM
ncbi:MAG: hypothetical protein JJU16_08865 [Alkalibacterium sp.]|nr:hypothetical protein [Alkalibacterium sp.]